MTLCNFANIHLQVEVSDRRRVCIIMIVESENHQLLTWE